MRDLHNLIILIERLIDKVGQADEYSDSLEKILQICAIPPIMTLSSDILVFCRSFEEYFAMLGI